MKIVFMGTPDFAAASLQAILNSKHQCQAVFTQPDKPKGRGKKIQMSAVKELALASGLPVYQPAKLRDGKAMAVLQELAPDAIVVAAYGRILPQEILDLPRYGCINVHASILPKYRGAAPIHHAIINGEKESGVTIMQMDAGMDTGDILMLEKIKISPEMNTGDLYERLAVTGGSLLIKTLDELEKGTLSSQKQNESQATYAPMLSKEDEVIDWRQPAINLHQKIRGMNPWPGVHTMFRGQRLKIQEACIPLSKDVKPAKTWVPGEVINTSEEGLLVATGQGQILLRQVQPAGKKIMPATDFVRGYQIKEGEILQ